MRAVASALAALALGTVLSGQAFAQYYGPESDDDAADSRPSYSDRYAPGSDFRSAYRDREDDVDDTSLRREPVRRYYRDSRGEWRPLSRRYGYDEPSYRDERRPAERYRGGARVGEWQPIPPRRSSSNYDRPSYRDDAEERVQRDERLDESRPSYRRYSEPRERDGSRAGHLIRTIPVDARQAGFAGRQRLQAGAQRELTPRHHQQHPPRRRKHGHNLGRGIPRAAEAGPRTAPAPRPSGIPGPAGPALRA